jgi:hypothetical protein
MKAETDKPDDLDNQPEIPPEVHAPEATNVETAPSPAPAVVETPAPLAPAPISSGEQAPKIVPIS